jgi:hypothetical protein
MGILKLLIILFFIILIVSMIGIYPTVALTINTFCLISLFLFYLLIKEEF